MLPMNWTAIDWAIAAIAGVSVGLGLWRGFMREVLSLAGWMAGLWLAGQDRRWVRVRIDVVGVRVGRQRTPEVTHLRGVG